MKSYRNQKIITIQKATSDKNNLYAIFNLAATRQAMKNLSPTGFILFSYLNMNQRGYTMALSKKHFMEQSGLSENTYLKAVKELIEKCYLVQDSEDSSKYIFYEDTSPESVSATPTIELTTFIPTWDDEENLKRYIKNVKAKWQTIEETEAAILRYGYSEECTAWYISGLRKAIGQ